MIVLTTQLTKDYYEKAKNFGFFDSIKKNWKEQVQIGCIDFIPEDPILPYYYIDSKNIKTFRTNYPHNRKKFICPQSGEFVDFMRVHDNTIIVNIDADTILQRELTEQEYFEISSINDEILLTYPTKPYQTLWQVMKNLKMKDSDIFNDSNILSKPEFCGAFLIAKAKTFRKLAEDVVANFDELVRINTHHAGIQFIISYLIHKNFQYKILNNYYCFGDWYTIDYNYSIKQNKLRLDDKEVLFNHHKFIRKYNY